MTLDERAETQGPVLLTGATGFLGMELIATYLDLTERCAARGALRRFAHVSTAYVAGTHEGTFSEADLYVGQSFRNAYERSKYEAERLIRDRVDRLPAVTVVRPSIIVGESRTGWTPAFNVLYVPVRAFAE